RSDVIVAVVGEAAEMSGESASRTEITLPPSQRRLLEALLRTGKPIVMVLFTGRPLVLVWEYENIPAILNVWFAGTQSGNAIADVVFGRVNPSGKLPVTFPRSVGQIPIFYNHKQTGRPLGDDQWFRKFRTNYLDVHPSPLFPFGFGLSFTTFAYGDIMVDKTELLADDTLTASITVKNTGAFDGAEVVQLYTRQMVGSITRPVKELKGFQKVFLKAGESRNVVFRITPNDLKFYNYDLVYDWEPGEFRIMIGGSSDDVSVASVNWKK
ncbi:MAG TPA: glycoside hydrolase family 3 C-terminal domain-containing protein, partial [Bacteroidales bacterium]|nr:glycoside hydrolase family 3 C-terminal domain-containing protein [Bacteroidales bacterium]